MNCISGSILAACLVAFSACGAPASEATENQADSRYTVHYAITPDPGRHSVTVSMQLTQSRRQLRELTFSSDRIDLSSVVADGDIRVTGQTIRWRPGTGGGNLSWRISVGHQRNNSGYDAWLDDAFGIFRAEDIVPRATTRALKAASSITSFSFDLPSNWSVITEYKNQSGMFSVNNVKRRFDQPTGWIALGQLGVRRETIAGVRVAIAAPAGQSARRMDMLALLNWTLPELHMILAELPPRLTIVSADDPMWRGGLSAPASIYVHAARPLISENATSTLLHEVMHVALRINARHGYDWIVEGLAEYYSLDLLQRGGAITARRYKAALQEQSAWGKKAKSLCSDASSGATTAFAVTLFRELDKEIRAATAGQSGLDDVTALLANADSAIGLNELYAAAEALLGKPSDLLHIDKLPGCRSIAATAET